MCVSMIGMSASGSAARAFFKTAGTAVAATAAFTKVRRETGGGEGMGRKGSGSGRSTAGIELADRLERDHGPADFLVAKCLTATANGGHVDAARDCRVALPLIPTLQPGLRLNAGDDVRV